ncbi:iron-siderophore ABC transporter substrate-binding protein [Nodosilinea sp. LEGE 07298]|uniref:ABC transporter substrate-binding protein n=1 Tax=Nodosilinea sp. LEGE 07298 TaxID=2777970 RepID=UPI001880551E|nr:iron-siderophore ABC transporter substrate-binding protein [Nodosilinea sp. LEGE 07298]MBE9112562.1 iron-siderophore ABC transporter substrate-binding protein [Nodosilinea sp. LEGE 07298]
MIYKSWWRRIQLFWGGVLIVALIQSCAGLGPPHANVPSAPEASDCHMVRHALGETCVPNQPQRVITLSVPTLGDAIALGVKPIATIVYFDEPPPYLAEHLDSIQILGKEEQPSLEKILALKPDLIIGIKYSTEAIYSQLSQIAPTVADDWEGYPSWREHFDFVANVLGKTDLAQQVWSRYYQRIESLKTALEKSQQNPEISFVHTCCGTIDLDLKNSFNGSILADAGLRRPSAQAVPVDGGLVKLSEEQLMDIDGDVLFVAADGAEAAQTITELKQNPLWQKLRAVQNDRVYPVNYPTWRGGNPLGADGVIDDLFTYLVEDTPPA